MTWATDWSCDRMSGPTISTMGAVNARLCVCAAEPTDHRSCTALMRCDADDSLGWYMDYCFTSSTVTIFVMSGIP